MKNVTTELSFLLTMGICVAFRIWLFWIRLLTFLYKSFGAFLFDTHLEVQLLGHRRGTKSALADATKHFSKVAFSPGIFSLCMFRLWFFTLHHWPHYLGTWTDLVKDYIAAVLFLLWMQILEGHEIPKILRHILTPIDTLKIWSSPSEQKR